jgi:hypothetical protein
MDEMPRHGLPRQTSSDELSFPANTVLTQHSKLEHYSRDLLEQRNRNISKPWTDRIETLFAICYYVVYLFHIKTELMRLGSFSSQNTNSNLKFKSTK